MGGIIMAKICKNNIFRLFIGGLLRIGEEGELKAVMQSLHGWSDEEYGEYLNIFIEKWNESGKPIRRNEIVSPSGIDKMSSQSL